MKPVILITVYRRYFELRKNLYQLQKLFHLFEEPPKIVVVWSCPQVGMLWLFEELMADGLIHEVITRQALPGEGQTQATSVFESHNIQMGLKSIFEKDPDCYCIFMAADVSITERCLKYIIGEMNAGYRCIAFIWSNGWIPGGCYHTNIFAVKNFPEFFPPLAKENDADVLERQFALQVAKLPGLTVSGNYNNSMFSHNHESELNDPLPVIPKRNRCNVELYMRGYIPIRTRLRNAFRWLVRVISFRRK